jgi:hypothetical protein
MVRGESKNAAAVAVQPGGASRKLAAVLLSGHPGETPVTVLRDTLLEGIEALRPGHNTPRDSRIWRIYTILRRRFVEQIGQGIVARDMGLSVRQLQREEKVSRQALADYLWAQNGLDAKIEEIARLMEKREPPAQESDANTRSREIEWLRETAEYEETSVDMLFEEVLHTAAPILRINQIGVEQPSGGGAIGGGDMPGKGVDEGRPLHLPAALIRQAMLNVLAVLSKRFPGGRLCLTHTLSAVDLRIHINCSITLLAEGTECCREMLLREFEDAVSLLAIFGGVIIVEQYAARKFCGTTLTIPLKRQSPILVIDDNADSLLLMERYLTGSAYRFHGIRDSHEAVRAAERPSRRGLSWM